MSFNQQQFRDLITRTLERMGLYSPSAVELLMGTAAQESHLGHYLRQIKGPALGVFQMEPETERDIWTNYLSYRPDKTVPIIRTTGQALASNWALETNLAYQIVMARLHYLRIPDPLPYYADIRAMAKYWDIHYNRNPEKGFPDEFIDNYERLCT